MIRWSFHWYCDRSWHKCEGRWIGNRVGWPAWVWPCGWARAPPPRPSPCSPRPSCWRCWSPTAVTWDTASMPCSSDLMASLSYRTWHQSSWVWRMKTSLMCLSRSRVMAASEAGRRMKGLDITRGVPKKWWNERHSVLNTGTYSCDVSCVTYCM